MATPNPTPERQAIVRAAGVQNVDAIAKASVRTGCPFYALAALIERESKGKNIYGHDQGGYDSGFKELEITMRNWHEFYAQVVVNNKRSNGVGPAQITYRGYFNVMLDRDLRPWKPFDNIVFGAELLWANFARTEDWAKAGTLYNAGNLDNGINDYGREFRTRAYELKRMFNAVG